MAWSLDGKYLAVGCDEMVKVYRMYLMNDKDSIETKFVRKHSCSHPKKLVWYHPRRFATEYPKVGATETESYEPTLFIQTDTQVDKIQVTEEASEKGPDTSLGAGGTDFQDWKLQIVHQERHVGEYLVQDRRAFNAALARHRAGAR